MWGAAAAWGGCGCCDVISGPRWWAGTLRLLLPELASTNKLRRECWSLVVIEIRNVFLY